MQENILLVPAVVIASGYYGSGAVAIAVTWWLAVIKF